MRESVPKITQVMAILCHRGSGGVGEWGQGTQPDSTPLKKCPKSLFYKSKKLHDYVSGSEETKSTKTTRTESTFSGSHYSALYS